MAEQTRVPLIPRSAPWGEVRGALMAAGKSNRNAPAYSRWINRPLGRVFAATGYKLGLTPNAISLISAAFTYAGIALIATGSPSWWLGVVVCLLLVVGYALDSADGQVARLRGGGSLAGEWLDHVLDAFKNTSFHLAVAVMWFRSLGDWPQATTLVPMVFALQATGWFFTMILTDLLLRNAGVKKQVLAVDEGRQPIWTSLLGIPADYGFLCLVMVLLGWYPVWRWLYVLLAVANVLLLFLQLARWYRRVAAVG
jgi:phosphatidylglycerophosphate synthase